MHAFLLLCDLEHLLQAPCDRRMFDQEVQVQACLRFSITRKCKPQEVASGGKSTALSLCCIQRRYSICLSATTADNVQKTQQRLGYCAWLDWLGRQVSMFSYDNGNIHQAASCQGLKWCLCYCSGVTPKYFSHSRRGRADTDQEQHMRKIKGRCRRRRADADL